MRTVLLIDGRNLAWRQLHTHKWLSSKGRPTGLLYGFLNSLCRLARLHPGACFVICWDGPKAKTKSWRNGIYKEYKANRLEPKKQKGQSFLFHQVNNQIPQLQHFLSTLGFHQIEIEDLEADDVIGILASHAKNFVDKIIIYSTDRDFYQLIDGEKIFVVRDTDKTKNCKPVKIRDLRNEFGVGPKHWLRYRALVGDKGDNILKDVQMKIGDKTAVKLIRAGFNASQKDYSFSDQKYKRFWKKIRLNYRLSKILRSIDSPELKGYHLTRKRIEYVLRRYKCFDDFRRPKVGKTKQVYQAMIEFFGEYEMADLLTRRNQLWRIP